MSFFIDSCTGKGEALTSTSLDIMRGKKEKK